MSLQFKYHILFFTNKQVDWWYSKRVFKENSPTTSKSLSTSVEFATQVPTFRHSCKGREQKGTAHLSLLCLPSQSLSHSDLMSMPIPSTQQRWLGPLKWQKSTSLWDQTRSAGRPWSTVLSSWEMASIISYRATSLLSEARPHHHPGEAWIWEE